MKCPNCKTENPLSAKFCKACQYPLERRPNLALKCPKCGKRYRGDMLHCTDCHCELVERPPRKKLRVLIISLSIALVLVAAGIVGAFVLYPPYAFQKAIENDDSTRLASVCETYPHLLKDEDRREQYGDFIVERADAYVDSAITYEVVVVDFENFDTINSHLLDDAIKDNTAQQKIRVETIYNSRVAFAAAEDAYQKKEYKLAEENYDAVVEEDAENYKSTQSRFQEITALKESYLTQSADLLEEQDYAGSITALAEGQAYFGYDAEYDAKYQAAIVDCVVQQSDDLMDQGLYFTSGTKTGAFNLVYSYLEQEAYEDNEILLDQIETIAAESEPSELAAVEEALELPNRHTALDNCAATAAEDYCLDSSIQDDNQYTVSLCTEDPEVQKLIAQIPEEKQVMAALICNMAVNTQDFIDVCQEQLDAYDPDTLDYTGIGRYYDPESRTFSWAVVIIYELG